MQLPDVTTRFESVRPIRPCMSPDAQKIDPSLTMNLDRNYVVDRRVDRRQKGCSGRPIGKHCKTLAISGAKPRSSNGSRCADLALGVYT